MALYAIGDTHLSLSSNKPMDVFGGGWEGYVDKLQKGFAAVGPEDTVVLCGDLSWGMSLEEAKKDFAFLDALPGAREAAAQGKPRLLVEHRRQDEPLFSRRAAFQPSAFCTTTAMNTGATPCAAPGAGSMRRPATRRCSSGS
mgnify:CR=1 FL=1